MSRKPDDKLAGENCVSCRFYREPKLPMPLPDGVALDTRGTCLRFPATLAKLHTEWCGEWRPQRSSK